MSAQSRSILTLPVTATGTVTNRRFVTYAGVRAGAAAQTLGVAQWDAVSGEDVSVDVLGTAVVESGGAITAGGALETDSSGRAVANSSGPVVARAIQAASGAGQFIEAVLIPN